MLLWQNYPMWITMFILFERKIRVSLNFDLIKMSWCYFHVFSFPNEDVLKAMSDINNVRKLYKKKLRVRFLRRENTLLNANIAV